MASNSTGFFSEASNFTIHRQQFLTSQTNIQSLAIESLDSPLETLYRNQALEATHTSKTAASAPKCKPGTRIKAIKDITSWADDVLVDLGLGPPEESILWFRGPAGSGKTCIMREVTRICREKGTLAGDYFFSTRVPGLDDEAPFVATIVSYLITAIPALEILIQEAIRSNPNIFEQSLELQMEKLISNHLSTVRTQVPAPRILIVDGFDECRDHKQRAHLLRLLYSLITPPHSFRVILASRPEYDIRTAFEQPPLKAVTKVIWLEKYQAAGEIYKYLSDEFSRIRQTHPAKESLPSDWPGQAKLHALTDKSSGIFTYPATVIKYVDNPRRHPVDLLEHVLKPNSAASSGRPFAELDALYEIILNPPDIDIPLMKRLLHVIIEITRLSPVLFPVRAGEVDMLTRKILSPHHLDCFLSMRRGSTEMILCDLHSVLSTTEDVDRPWVYFHHKTLEDYLCSSQRAGDLHQSQEDTRSDILTTSIHNIRVGNEKLRSPNPDLDIVDFALNYSCVVWKHMFFEERDIPPSALDFDVRDVWRPLAVARILPPEEEVFKDFVDRFHNAMCNGREECQPSCISFRYTLGYLGRLRQVIKASDMSHPITKLQLKRFEEEEFKGYFPPAVEVKEPPGTDSILKSEPLPQPDNRERPRGWEHFMSVLCWRLKA